MERIWTTILYLCVGVAFATAPVRGPPEGDDLLRYTTRPEIRPPKLEIIRAEPESTPGYWFVAPYVDVRGGDHDSRYIPFQVGPHIYRSDGELVWSGAELVNNRNTFDFRLQSVNGQPALTYILSPGNERDADRNPYGVILDTSYRPLRHMPLQENGWIWNLHEFLIYNETTSLSVMEEGYLADVSSFDLPHPVGPIWQYGFHETDVNSNKTWRAWRPLDVNITTAESMIQTPQDWLHDGPGWDNPFWDCYHINSIDKDAEGDFLVSMRYTSTIYKISGRDGSVIWRLGGKQSDFQQDFNFSSQHFARFHSQQRSANENETIISFLDNASDERDRQPATSETSSIKVVSIYDDGQTKRATLLRQLDRPDGGLTKLRGSAQPLSNGGFAAGWSEGGYISEFAPDGRTVFEARFTSDRFNTYRAYKFDFVGTPAEPPVLKTFALSRGSSDSDSDSDEGALADMSTSFFVSWNGATEVHTWDFYVTNNMSMPAYKAGSVKMTTFETTFWTTEFWAYAYAEARDASNRTLGRSDWVSVALAPGKMQREYNESRLALEAGALQAEQRQELSGSGGILRIFPVIAVVGMSLITLGLVGSWAVKRFEFVAALVGGGGFRAHRRSGGVVVKEVNYEWSARRHARFLEDWTQQKDALLKSFAVDIDDDDDCEKGPEELAGEGFVDDGNGRMRHGDV